MVFPVFARALESARKAVCLSNVKNVALAFQMYMADNNDTLPPAEHRQDVLDYFNTAPGNSGQESVDENGECGNLNDAAATSNPYLRWPVVLDEYVKNRDVWRCPSAKMQKGAGWIVPGPDWFGYLKATQGGWPYSGSDDWIGGPCEYAWPPGWGGVITDSIKQNAIAQDNMAGIFGEKVFVQSVGTSERSREVKLAAVNDPVSFYICGDAGAQCTFYGIGVAAYPDICNLECGVPCGCSPDWEIAIEGGADPACVYIHAPNDGSFLANPELRKPYARHLGGSNCGFLDGHARWYNAESLIKAYADGEISGIVNDGPNSKCDGGYFPATYPGVPTLF